MRISYWSSDVCSSDLSRNGIAQGERAMGGEFGHQPIGKRAEHVVVLVFLLALARRARQADADDGWRRTIFQVIGRIDPVRLIAIRDHAVIVVLDRLVLGPHEDALDIERTVAVDADENPTHRPVLGREDRRPRHYRRDLIVDSGDSRLALLGPFGLAPPYLHAPAGLP